MIGEAIMMPGFKFLDRFLRTIRAYAKSIISLLETTKKAIEENTDSQTATSVSIIGALAENNEKIEELTNHVKNQNTISIAAAEELQNISKLLAESIQNQKELSDVMIRFFKTEIEATQKMAALEQDTKPTKHDLIF